ncbi:MAG: SDR family oxidoreductase [Rhizobiales bacterium]|nr:SDR family oxidoreductase [Hyphomicrobiales bacterium]NRB15152.1 SDR family oxidoreductase [Hyphomicrobiales bacterium]
MSQLITLITGASGGIGAELAQQFANQGENLLLVARSGDKLETVAAKLRAQYKVEVAVLALDLSAIDAAKTLLTFLGDEKLEVKHLVNNAGFGLNDAVQKLSTEEQLNMLDLNVRSLTELTRLMLDQVIKHKGGVLNVASVLSFLPTPYMAVYGASKAYVLSFTEALAVECQDLEVKICALCPGSTKTEFGKRAKYQRSEMLENSAMMSAQQVAILGFNGYMRGKTIVITGGVNKIIPIFTRLMPRGLLAKIMGKFMMAT